MPTQELTDRFCQTAKPVGGTTDGFLRHGGEGPVPASVDRHEGLLPQLYGTDAGSAPG